MLLGNRGSDAAGGWRRQSERPGPEKDEARKGASGDAQKAARPREEGASGDAAEAESEDLDNFVCEWPATD